MWDAFDSKDNPINKNKVRSGKRRERVILNISILH
jgi:hypothetical protein